MAKNRVSHLSLGTTFRNYWWRLSAFPFNADSALAKRIWFQIAKALVFKR